MKTREEHLTPKEAILFGNGLTTDLVAPANIHRTVTHKQGQGLCQGKMTAHLA